MNKNFQKVLQEVPIDEVVGALKSALKARKQTVRRGATIDYGPDYSVQLRAVELWKGIQEAALKLTPEAGASNDLAEHWEKVRQLQSRQSRVS